MAGYRYTDAIRLTADQIAARVAPCAVKFAWFLKNGYVPHYWQTLFHTAWRGATSYQDEDDSLGLCRYRHLVAGRRGGKTMSAAWEVAFYVTHPEEFHWDVHRKRSTRPLTVWVVTKDFPLGHPALVWFREVLKEAGLTHGVEYKENRGNHWFEFDNGSFVHFRSAEDPESLRGAGLDIIWMDEAAMIPDERAWQVSRPALSDKVGIVLTTTTPDGKNWLYDEFWSPAAQASANQARIEYRSIDNVHFPQAEWEELLETYHPLMFKREYMASFDSMAGKELSGEWLHYYDWSKLPTDKESGRLDLDVYIGVDPAVSLADTADRFVIAVVGVTKDKNQAYLLDMYADRIPFVEQLEKIQDYFLEYRQNLQFIGIESVAYQQVLVQQALRMPGFLPVIPMMAPGKKSQRILAMSPLFRAKRILIRKDHNDFINEWLDYDSTRKNPKDDCLDATEIALRTAGALLPMQEPEPITGPPTEWNDLIALDMPRNPREDRNVDEHLGGDW